MRILSVRLSRFGVLAILLVLAAFVVIGLASPAHAADATNPTVQGTPILTVDAGLVALVAGILIPLLNTLLTKLTASPLLKSIVAIVLAGITAVGAAVAGVSGATDVKGLVIVFLLALVSAAGHRFTWLSGVENWLARKFPNKGVGSGPAVQVVHGPTDPTFG
jgi:uncharacterized protein YacL